MEFFNLDGKHCVILFHFTNLKNRTLCNAVAYYIIETAWEDDLARDILEPDAEANGDEIVLNIVEVVDNVVQSEAAALPVVIFSRVNNSCMRFYDKKKSICYSDSYNGTIEGYCVGHVMWALLSEDYYLY